MEEIGKVTKIKDTSAFVEVDRKAECSKCGMCGMKDGMPSIEIECSNNIKAEVGDIVKFASKKNTRLLAAVLVFFVPLVLLALSIVISYKLISSEIWILVICLLTLILWYTILAVIDKKISKISGFCPNIVEIVRKNTNKEGENNNE